MSRNWLFWFIGICFALISHVIICGGCYYTITSGAGYIVSFHGIRNCLGRASSTSQSAYLTMYASCIHKINDTPVSQKKCCNRFAICLVRRYGLGRQMCKKWLVVLRHTGKMRRTSYTRSQRNVDTIYCIGWIINIERECGILNYSLIFIKEL